jgi:Actin
MRCDAEEHPVLLTEPAWNTVANRERMAEIMFEEFRVPAFYIANTGVLNAYVTFLYITIIIFHLTLVKIRGWEGLSVGDRCWTDDGERYARRRRIRPPKRFANPYFLLFLAHARSRSTHRTSILCTPKTRASARTTHSPNTRSRSSSYRIIRTPTGSQQIRRPHSFHRFLMTTITLDDSPLNPARLRGTTYARIGWQGRQTLGGVGTSSGRLKNGCRASLAY